MDSQIISKPAHDSSYTWNEEVGSWTRPKLGNSLAKWTLTNLREEQDHENELLCSGWIAFPTSSSPGPLVVSTRECLGAALNG